MNSARHNKIAATRKFDPKIIAALIAAFGAVGAAVFTANPWSSKKTEPPTPIVQKPEIQLAVSPPPTVSPPALTANASKNSADNSGVALQINGQARDITINAPAAPPAATAPRPLPVGISTSPNGGDFSIIVESVQTGFRKQYYCDKKASFDAIYDTVISDFKLARSVNLGTAKDSDVKWAFVSPAVEIDYADLSRYRKSQLRLAFVAESGLKKFLDWYGTHRSLEFLELPSGQVFHLYPVEIYYPPLSAPPQNKGLMRN